MVEIKRNKEDDIVLKILLRLLNYHKISTHEYFSKREIFDKKSWNHLHNDKAFSGNPAQGFIPTRFIREQIQDYIAHEIPFSDQEIVDSNHVSYYMGKLLSRGWIRKELIVFREKKNKRKTKPMIVYALSRDHKALNELFSYFHEHDMDWEFILSDYSLSSLDLIGSVTRIFYLYKDYRLFLTQLIKRIQLNDNIKTILEKEFSNAYSSFSYSSASLAYTSLKNESAYLQKEKQYKQMYSHISPHANKWFVRLNILLHFWTYDYFNAPEKQVYGYNVKEICKKMMVFYTLMLDYELNRENLSQTTIDNFLNLIKDGNTLVKKNATARI